MFSMVLASTTNAQNQKKRTHFNREAYESQKNAYIIAELKLTPEEAATFIPLTNELEKKRFEVVSECKRVIRKVSKMETPTNEDYNNAIDVCFKTYQKEAEIINEYYPKFKKILSPEKLFKYRNVEMKFKQNFMRERNKEK